MISIYLNLHPRTGEKENRTWAMSYEQSIQPLYSVREEDEIENMCWLINLHLKAEQHIMMKNLTNARIGFIPSKNERKIEWESRLFFYLWWLRNVKKRKYKKIWMENLEFVAGYCSLLVVYRAMKAYGVIYEMKNAVLHYNLFLL